MEWGCAWVIVIVVSLQRLISHHSSASPFRVSRPQCPSEDAKQQDHRRGAPRPRAAYHWSLRVWCGCHEGFEGKSPVWVLEHYLYALQPRPSSSSQVTTRPMHAIANVSLDGGSTYSSYSKAVVRVLGYRADGAKVGSQGEFHCLINIPCTFP